MKTKYLLPLLNLCLLLLFPLSLIAGRRVRNALYFQKNGNSIFIPAAGSWGTSKSNTGEVGCYWSSTPSADCDSQSACYLIVDLGGEGAVVLAQRRYGFSVRPVLE